MLLNLLVTFRGLNLKHKIYIMIDEYDNFTNAILKGDGKDFLELVNRNGYVRAFYEIIKMKLEEGVIDRFFATGVMPVTLDNLTSGFNIATNLSTDPEFTSMIGFTHEEVRHAVEEVVPLEEIEKVYKDLEVNYDGYRFSLDKEEKTFNSTLVLYYLKNYVRMKSPPRNILDVNMNTSGDKVKRVVELINPKENYKTVEEIILKNEITGILKDVVLNETYDTDDLLTMLFYLGYLTISKVEYNQVTFQIPNYVTSTIFAEYMAKVINENKNYNIDVKDIDEAIKNLAINGNINSVVSLVKNFLKYSSNRDMENFNEKTLKYVFAMFLSLTRQYAVYGEYPAKQGFADIYVQKKSESVAKYEAIIELKYMSKKEGKKANKKKLLKEAKEQLKKYMEDKRLNEKLNLKKYVIIFIGFGDVIVEEI